MRAFYFKCVVIFLFIVGMGSGLVAISGCKSEQNVAAHLAVNYATAKYIEKGGEHAAHRAARVLIVADSIEALAAGESVTVAELKSLVIAKLPPSLSVADRVLAGALIDAAVIELQASIGDGVLNPGARLKLREVLTWVREGAALYNGSP